MGFGRLSAGMNDPLRPIQIQLAVRSRAVPKIQVDETLIRDASILRNGLEIADRFLVKANRDLLFELGCIRILFGIGEVVFFAHVTPFRGRTLTLWRSLCGPR